MLYAMRGSPNCVLQACAHHRTRTYDLSITYDKYYQTPRLWQACDIEIAVAEYDVKEMRSRRLAIASAVTIVGV